MQVKIYPWVGENYRSGGGVFRQRTLILGGSHYCEGHESFDPEEVRPEWQSFTNDVVYSYLDPNVRGRWKGTFTAFINSIFGDSSDDDQRRAFFDSVIFYNYLQEIAGATPAEVGDYSYTAPRHFSAFSEIVEKFRPEVMISWGGKVWEALPNDWGYGPVDIQDGVTVDNQTSQKVYQYPYGNSFIRLVGVRHPSIGYSPGYYHQVFQHLNILV